MKELVQAIKEHLEQTFRDPDINIIDTIHHQPKTRRFGHYATIRYTLEGLWPINNQSNATQSQKQYVNTVLSFAQSELIIAAFNHIISGTLGDFSIHPRIKLAYHEPGLLDRITTIALEHKHLIQNPTIYKQLLDCWSCRGPYHPHAIDHLEEISKSIWSHHQHN